jgi:hypothetical protein
VDAARDHSAALSNGLERLRHERADGRKNNHGIELHGRQFIRTAGPDRAKRQRKLLRFAVARSGKRVYFAVLVFGHLSNDVCSGAKSVDPESLAISCYN